MSAVVHDLPVPVVPSMAKCLPSSSSTRTMAGIDGVLTDAADAHRTARVAAEGSAELGLRGNAHAIAERGIGGDAAGEDRRLRRSRRATARRRGPARRSRSRYRRRGARAPERSRPRRSPARRFAPCRWPSACPCRAARPARALAVLRAVEQHDGLRAGHRHDAAERFVARDGARAAPGMANCMSAASLTMRIPVATASERRADGTGSSPPPTCPRPFGY